MRKFSRHFHLDFETYSDAPIGHGFKAYATHPSTEILLAAYAYDDDALALYDKEDQHGRAKHRAAIADACADPTVLLIAWNVPFEREILRHVWDIETEPEQWLDAMVVSYSLSLPGNLADASKVLAIPQDKAKMAEGKALIRRFCMPQPANQKTRRRTAQTDPIDWRTFGQYCKNDVEAERFALKRMWKYRPPQHELDLWHLDQRINERGLPIDMDLVAAAMSVSDKIKADLKNECAILTGLKNPNSRDQFLEFIQGEGFEGESLSKDRVDAAVREGKVSALGVKALALRSQFSKNSVAKYQKIEQQAVDCWLRYTLQFNGAGRTCRWAGRGAQYHNLPRPPRETKDPKAMEQAVDIIKRGDAELMRTIYDRPVDVLAGAIRPTLRAPDGKTLRIADYNAIENRVLGWVAQCDRILDVFRRDLDPYKDFGVKMFGHYYGEPGTREYDAIYNALTGQQRTDAKPAVLGAGYMLGGGELKYNKKTGLMAKTGLWAYAENLGVELSKEDSHEAVKVFRETYPEVVDFWNKIDEAVRFVIQRRPNDPRRLPVGFSGEHIEIGFKKPFLYIRLPSGRCLWYMRPKVELCPMPWENDDGSQAWAMGVSYEGVNQVTNKWGKVTTHKGKLTENVVQAIARDILANGLREAVAEGYTPVLHVHDEVVCLEDEDDDARTVDHIEQVLCRLPDWARDLPMKAAGFESKFYIKD